MKDNTGIALCDFIHYELRRKQSNDFEAQVEQIMNKCMHKYHYARRPSPFVWVLSKDAFEKLDQVIKTGLDPRRITKKYFFDHFNRFFNYDEQTGRLHIWTKSTVIGLESRGFPVSCDDIITVDDL